MIDSDKLKKFSWFLFVFLVSILALGLSSFKYFLPVYFTIFLCAITWTLYLVYVCESFTLYMTSLLVTIASIFCSFASLSAYLVATKFWGKASAPALMAGLAPFGITSLTYLLLVNGKPSFHPFEYDGIKVQPRPEKKQKKNDCLQSSFNSWRNHTGSKHFYQSSRGPYRRDGCDVWVNDFLDSVIIPRTSHNQRLA